MPYIKPSKRVLLNNGYEPLTGGELNYCVSRLVDEFVATKGLSYDTIEAVLAALEGAKSEFYFRIARTYEDRKIEENGEVFHASLRELELDQ